jgi:DNA topoisomerase-2
LDLIHFSNDDCSRSIPSLVDGFKPSQRKILYGAALRGLDKDEVKVAQLAGFVSDKAAYHHGEASLMGAIIGMAQNFVGSNNINPLKPNGQFGSRLRGGKDAASPRYIWTMFENITTKIFMPCDNPILNQQDDDGLPIEPEFYAPIIPMILINGAKGIGTGFSTTIPPFNPKEVIENIKNKLTKKPYKFMSPWYQGFKGEIKKKDDNSYEIYGKWHINEKGNKLIIHELPIGEWSSDYKEFLEKMLDDTPPPKKEGAKNVKEKEKKKNPFLSYSDNNTDTKVHFELEFEPEYLENIKDIESTFHLMKKVSLGNMHLYNKKGAIQKYETIESILNDYFDVRLELYQKRKDYLLAELEAQLKVISWKVKFILMIVEKKLEVNNKKKSDIEAELEKHKFMKNDNSYNYLLSMPIYNLTNEKIEELKKQEKDKQAEFDALVEKTPEQLWTKDLEELETAYDKWVEAKETPVTKKKTKL